VLPVVRDPRDIFQFVYRTGYDTAPQDNAAIVAHDHLGQTMGNEISKKYLGLYLNETLSVTTPKLVTHSVLHA